ncbi:hypothetical protein EDD21DRAFT_448046 [Dissophora ornata]|nr:hypothetical protein EDD21DRAFT_448046 [Dissophora ornata]
MPSDHTQELTLSPTPLRHRQWINTYGEHGAAVAGANDEDEDMEESNSTFASPGGGRKPSLTNSPPRDEGKPSRKTIKSRAAIQKLVDEAVEYEEDGQGQDGLDAQSRHGKGLGYYAPLVCDRVEARLVATYNYPLTAHSNINLGWLVKLESPKVLVVYLRQR